MNRFKFSVVAIAAILVSTSAALAQNYVFTKIADTTTSVPGTGGTYSSFGLPVAEREDQGDYEPGDDIFYFEAQSSNGIDGIYAYSPYLLSGPVESVALVANATMTAPTGGTFASFSNLTGGFRGFGFIAQGNNGVQGVYVATVNAPTSFTMIADTGSSPMPGSIFGNFEGLSIFGYGEPPGLLAINGEILSDGAVYNFSVPAGPGVYPPATFTELTSTSVTPVGASGPFSTFGAPSYKASETNDQYLPGNSAFVSAIRATAGGTQGIYYTFRGFSSNTNGLQLLVNTTTLIPSGTGHYVSFGDPVVSSSEIAFTADYTTSAGIQQGIFSYGEYLESSPITPQVYQILATGQIAPDSGGAHFASFGTIALALSGGIFIATLDDGVEGLFSFGDLTYERDGGSGSLFLSKILDTSDMLAGKSIANIEISSEANDGEDVFKVDFADGSEGIYSASPAVPEPASLGLLALPMLLISRRHRLI